MKKKELKNLKSDELGKRLHELRLELLKERGNIEMGGNIKNPGKIKILRRDIARIMTLINEREER